MSRRRQSKSSEWRRRQEKDIHVRAARQAGYRSRAAYKLLEINDAAALLAPGARVIDLGAAPGGWSQVITAKVGTAGSIVAVDLLPMQAISGVSIIHGDFSDTAIQADIITRLGGRADSIVSDMSPNLTGIRITDQERAVALGLAALSFAANGLKHNGAILIKAFEGEQRQQLDDALQSKFSTVRTLRLKATRPNSREIYLLGKGFIGGRQPAAGAESL